jgi:hypothetical protein
MTPETEVRLEFLDNPSKFIPRLKTCQMFTVKDYSDPTNFFTSESEETFEDWKGRWNNNRTREYWAPPGVNYLRGIFIFWVNIAIDALGIPVIHLSVFDKEMLNNDDFLYSKEGKRIRKKFPNSTRTENGARKYEAKARHILNTILLVLILKYKRYALYFSFSRFHTLNSPSF